MHIRKESCTALFFCCFSEQCCGTLQKRPSEAFGMKADSRWIWPVQKAGRDEYGEFYQPFHYSCQKAELRISADSNYAVYLNGRLAAIDQYPDYPHDKVYDVIDLTQYCTAGVNHLAIVVWYYGENNYSYVVGKAALRYELWLDETLAVFSGTHTHSRLSKTYRNGYAKIITGQLGFSYWYDLAREDGWMEGKTDDLNPSVIVHQQLPMRERPIPKFNVGERCEAKLLWSEGKKHFLFDLGRESVGYLTFSLTSAAEQKMVVAYGEHIADGGVRRYIHQRDFSVEYTLRKGANSHMNPFRRLGVRYLEVFLEDETDFEYLGICPADYPVTILERAFASSLRQRIYDVCVRTLTLCMHDHYEDTPWREQGLYAMDSRNQMLCGYTAFGEYAFPRANLLLMSKDNRKDHLLSICFPNADELTIPSFSLHYFTAVYEYTVHSGDQTLLQQIYPKLQSVLDVFIARMEEGIVPNWTDRFHWNFYEWSDGLSGALMKETPACVDAALNCLFVIALEHMQYFADLLGVQADYEKKAIGVRRRVHQLFFDSSQGSYRNSTLDDRRSVLVNALAVLSGVVKGEEAEKLAAKLADPSYGWMPATLSMVCFQYDALIKVDADRYRSFILHDIDTKYQKMLDAGATSVWETEDGECAFGGAGSLCHAWSSMPVYYYHLLNA